jgi:hypothetical protein
MHLQCKSIIKADYLKLPIEYKKGRLVLENPPFGDSNNLSRSFYKKSVNICDGIAFILPISQLWNTDSLFEFDLVDSVPLGVLKYSGVQVDCCFNLYKRPSNGLNKKENLKNDLFSIHRDDQEGYNLLKEDLCIFRRGASSGKEKLENKHTQTYKIIVNDRNRVDEVKQRILSYDWVGFKKHQSAPSISKNDIYRIFINDKK